MGWGGGGGGWGVYQIMKLLKIQISYYLMRSRPVYMYLYM